MGTGALVAAICPPHTPSTHARASPMLTHIYASRKAPQTHPRLLFAKAAVGMMGPAAIVVVEKVVARECGTRWVLDCLCLCLGCLGVVGGLVGEEDSVLVRKQGCLGRRL